MAYTMDDARKDAAWLLECPLGVDRVQYAFTVGVLMDSIHSSCALRQFEKARAAVRNAVVSSLRKTQLLNLILDYEANWSDYVWDRYL